MKYRKKPVVIEARQLTGTAGHMYAVYQWVEGLTQGSYDTNDPTAPTPASGVSIDAGTGFMVIATLEGEMQAKPGDWIIRGVQGEFYPCKPDIFAATYEPADVDEAPASEGTDPRTVIQRAVQAIIEERDPEEKALVTGWVLSYETASVATLQAGYFGGGSLVPDQQSPAMSRGLAQNAADFYSPSNWAANTSKGGAA